VSVILVDSPEITPLGINLGVSILFGDYNRCLVNS
jgi:hypothetical protein